LADATAEIADAVNDAEVDAEDFADTLKEIISAGNAYQSYGGISEDMTGNVKFIITTEAVKAE
jgi:putative membrane protein